MSHPEQLNEFQTKKIVRIKNKTKTLEEEMHNHAKLYTIIINYFKLM